jgi:hypothetical protein
MEYLHSGFATLFPGATLGVKKLPLWLWLFFPTALEALFAFLPPFCFLLALRTRSNSRGFVKAEIREPIMVAGCVLAAFEGSATEIGEEVSEERWTLDESEGPALE